MTLLDLDAEPDCPPPPAATARTPILDPTTTPGRLRAERRSIADIPPTTWDALAAQNPWATPFSGWAFQRAWWDAYGTNAHEETLAVVPATAPAGSAPVAIVPLMHRHEVEADDEILHTAMRHGRDLGLTAVPPTVTAVFFGASYHADYATILAAPDDLPAVAAAVAEHIAEPGIRRPWDVVDLRRLRCGDPAADALAAAFAGREAAEGWSVELEREEVCPVIDLPVGSDMDDVLAGLGKKARHEIRRKIRRAESVGAIDLVASPDPLADLDTFIEFHQRKWGARGLFPDSPGGDQSRVLFRGLFELHGPAGPLRLMFLTIGGRRVAAGVHFETPDRILYYNAGVDPDARDLSPGVLMIRAYVARALAMGIPRLDFLRGDESYKYEWGARDEPIQRLLVRRRDQP